MNNIANRLSYFKKKGTYRSCKYIDSFQDAKVRINGKEVILLGSNHYLSLGNDEELKKVAIEAIKKYGVGTGGSRLTTGSITLHRNLEKQIARFKRTEDAIVYNTGYMTNLGVIASLCDRKWVIFSDQYNHASIVDGCLLSEGKLIRYKHKNMEDLERKIKKYNPSYGLIITDGVFSMDGDLAPLDEIVKMAKKYGLYTMVDDAHGVGILGNKGAGSVSYYGLEDEIDIQVGTLSKAIPSIGGYAAGKKHIIDYFKNTSRSFIFSTSLPPASLAVSIEAIKYIQNQEDTRKELLKMAKWFKNALQEMEFKVLPTITPIIPMIIGDSKKTHAMSKALLEEGIYVSPICPPTVPRGTSRLRISIMAHHTYEMLGYVLEKIYEHGKKLDIIQG